MITEETRKIGLDSAELEAQGAELLPDRVEMTKRRGRRSTATAIAANNISNEQYGLVNVNVQAGNTQFAAAEANAS